jgi:TPP-dependent pyruvate/acetoin dehydrogenase alpha subunit
MEAVPAIRLPAFVPWLIIMKSHDRLGGITPMMNLSPNLPPDKQREMLRQMLTIRRFEERASADYHAGKIYGVVHCYIGEEAVAVGVCTTLDRGDRIISTHRGHGHCIAKGADLNRMMAELYGRQTGYCKGKGGSMHIADFDIGMLLLRRRGIECRPLPRVPQHRGDLEAANALRV